MYFRFFITIFLLINLSGCITEADKQPQADQILTTLHQAIQNKQWDKASQLFDASFFKQEPKLHWQQGINQIQHELGPIQSFHITSKSKDPRFGGDFYIYIVSIKHEHGFSHETVTIFQSIDDDTLKISGYQIRQQGKS